MDAEQFKNMTISNSRENYGIFPPPTNAQEGLNILVQHFLGEDWYTTLSMHNEQVNTEAIYEILRKYPGKKTLKEKLINIFKKR